MTSVIAMWPLIIPDWRGRRPGTVQAASPPPPPALWRVQGDPSSSSPPPLSPSPTSSHVGGGWWRAPLKTKLYVRIQSMCVCVFKRLSEWNIQSSQFLLWTVQFQAHICQKLWTINQMFSVNTMSSTIPFSKIRSQDLKIVYFDLLCLLSFHNSVYSLEIEITHGRNFKEKLDIYFSGLCYSVT